MISAALVSYRASRGIAGGAGNRSDIDDGSRPALAHTGSHSLMRRKALFRLTSIILSNLASSTWQTGSWAILVAALLTRISILPNSRCGGIDQLLYVVGPAYMADQREDAARAILDFGGGLFERFLLAAADDDGGAFAGERFGDGTADAAARAGDDGNFIGESESGCGHLDAASRRRISLTMVCEPQ